MSHSCPLGYADDTEVAARAKVFVSHTGRNDYHVTCGQLVFNAAFAAELHGGRPAEHCQDFMGRAVVMMIRVDPVPPGPSPLYAPGRVPHRVQPATARRF